MLTSQPSGRGSKRIATAGIIVLILGLAAIVAVSTNRSTWTSERKMAVLRKNGDVDTKKTDHWGSVRNAQILQVGDDKSNKKCRRERNAQLAGYPKEDLAEFINVAAAAYVSGPAKYIEGYSDYNWKRCGKKRYWGFKAYCLLDQTNKRMYITFRGLSTGQIVACAMSLGKCMIHFESVANAPLTKQKFKRWIKKKYKKYVKKGDYTFFAMVGHSYGGFFASRLARKKYKVWRITFNALKAKRGTYTINMKKPGSDEAVNLSKKCRYFTVGGVKSHYMDAWFSVKNKAWTKFLPRGKTAVDLP